MNKVVRLLDVAFRTNPELLIGDGSKVNLKALSVVSGLSEEAVCVVLNHIEKMGAELKEKGFAK